MLKYVPSRILTRTPKGFATVPVTGVQTHPPGTHPGSCIRADMTAVEVKTPFQSRWFGTEKAYIDASLRMVMEINPRDEVLSKWEDAA